MTNYDAGRRLEWAVRDDLRNDGYDVTRSAGSHSPIDLFAIKPGQLLLVQCKKDGRIGPADRKELRRIAGNANALAVVAYKAKVGIGYRELTGDGPKDWEPWVADEVAG